MHAFAALGLKEELVQAVQDLGFEKPSPVQEQTIPLLLSNETDLVALAQTGTGKTAAFGLPLLEKIEVDWKQIQALILAPTRELCIQIQNELEKYGKHLKGFKSAAIYGGANIVQQKKQVEKHPQVVVATPGRLMDMMDRGWIKLNEVSYLILDEADEMLNMGFQEDIDKILEGVPSERFTWLFSATMPNEVARISKRYMNDPQEVKVAATNIGARNIEHFAYMVHERDRYLALKRLADFYPDIFGMVFCRTRRETQQIAEKLIEDGYPAAALHGDLSQAQRDAVMQQFRSRSIRMLVATDVAARGIDVDDISHVIHYRIPDDVESYTHRSGRTARAGKSGLSLALINMKEGGRLKLIERVSKVKFERQLLPSPEAICERQLLNLVKKVKDIKVDDSIKPFIEQVEHELIHLDRDELLQHFLSVEFNRFLSYYKNAKDLNVTRKTRDGDEGGGSSMRRKDVQRFFINLGKRDGLEWQDLKDLVVEVTGLTRDDIKGVDSMPNFGFFNVDKSNTDAVKEAFNGVVYEGRDVSIEESNEESRGGGGGSRTRKRRSPSGGGGGGSRRPGGRPSGGRRPSGGGKPSGNFKDRFEQGKKRKRKA